jgi:hypothetical protein
VICGHNVVGALNLPEMKTVDEFFDYIAEHPDDWVKGEPIYTTNDPPYWIKLSAIQKVVVMGC